MVIGFLKRFTFGKGPMIPASFLICSAKWLALYGLMSLATVVPGSPEEAADVASALVKSQSDFNGTLCVVTRDRIRIRPMHPAPKR